MGEGDGGPSLPVSAGLCDVHVRSCVHFAAASGQVEPTGGEIMYFCDETIAESSQNWDAFVL